MSDPKNKMKVVKSIYVFFYAVTRSFELFSNAFIAITQKIFDI